MAIIRVDGDELLVTLPDTGVDATLLTRPLDALLDAGAPENAKRIRVEMPPGRQWTITDAAFLASVAQRLDASGEPVAWSGLPPDLEQLLALARHRADGGGKDAGAEAGGFIERLGRYTIGRTGEFGSFVTLLGQVLLLLPAFVTGRAKVRRSEMVGALAQSSTNAVFIVGIVNLLVGAILAFVGAVQLKAFGAGIFVADLVGIASIRELTAIMTAIVLAGRTGASFAARIATMQGNEELDALATLGVPPVEFLVLPRVVALSLATPLLYVYASALSLLGGMLVALPILDLSMSAYIVQTRDAIRSTDFVLGGFKAFVFGGLVALIGCHAGLRASRSAAGVGLATTQAVVRSIVAIIAVDAVVAVCADALDI